MQETVALRFVRKTQNLIKISQRLQVLLFHQLCDQSRQSLHLNEQSLFQSFHQFINLTRIVILCQSLNQSLVDLSSLSLHTVFRQLEFTVNEEEYLNQMRYCVYVKCVQLYLTNAELTELTQQLLTPEFSRLLNVRVKHAYKLFDLCQRDGVEISLFFLLFQRIVLLFHYTNYEYRHFRQTRLRDVLFVPLVFEQVSHSQIQKIQSNLFWF